MESMMVFFMLDYGEEMFDYGVYEYGYFMY